MSNHNHLVTCQVTGEQVPMNDAMLISLVRPGIYDIIKRNHPAISKEGYISKEALKKFRGIYIENVLVDEGRELTTLEREVIASLVEHENMVKNLNDEFAENQTFGNKLSDSIAKFGGSWTFIIIFGIVLGAWITLNTFILVANPFDPYPYILLNLVLSCIAALQAPVIMMSQNRKDAKDRMRAEHDYKVNLKAELEIRHLHEKIDHMLQHQWQRMMEIQELQLDMMEGLDMKQKRKPFSSSTAPYSPPAAHTVTHDAVSSSSLAQTSSKNENKK